MEPTTIIIASLGIGTGILLQTVIGFAAPLIAVPILLFVLSLQDAVSLMSIFLFLFSIHFVYKHRHEMDRKVILQLGSGTVIGMPIGIYLLKVGNPVILKKLFGAVILLYVGHYYMKKRKIEVFNRLGFLFGLIGGIFSGLYSNGSPLYVTYINNKLESATTIRSTIIGILAVGNLLRVPLLLGASVLTTELLKTSLFILPTFFISIYVGQKLYHRINEDSFRHTVMIFLVLTAFSLILR